MIVSLLEQKTVMILRVCVQTSYESSFIEDCESTNESTKDDTEDEFYLK